MKLKKKKKMKKKRKKKNKNEHENQSENENKYEIENDKFDNFNKIFNATNIAYYVMRNSKRNLILFSGSS